MLIQVMGAFFAVLAFAIIFNVPKKFLFYCGIAGAGGWFIYLLLSESLKGGFSAVFVAAMLAALLSHVFARIFKAPVTIFLIPGILPLVPGVGMYRIVYYMIIGEGSMSSHYFNYTLQSAGAIAIAIFVMDTFFKIFQKKKV